MGLYTRITRDWLEHRFRRHTPTGAYLAHMPIYGYGTREAEGNQLGRLCRVMRILRELDGLSFRSLLDVGGAEGFLPHLARQLFGAEVATADLSHEANRRARELFGLPAAAVDSARLPFADGAFDVVVCSEVLEHVEHPVETILELQRVAKIAVVLTTEEVRYDRASIDDYLFRRPGWPHMERNLFHPDDLAACCPGARRTPQTDGPPPQDLDATAARAWLLAHASSEELAPGRIGIVVSDVREPAARRARRYSDAALLETVFARTVAPGSTWPAPTPVDELFARCRDPFAGGLLQRTPAGLLGASGTFPVVAEVPDFVRVDAPPPSREALAARLAGLPADRAAAMLALRDRLFLPERWSQDHFDLRQTEHRRGFWPNEQLVPRDGGHNDGFRWRSIGPDPWVLTPCLQRRVRGIEIEMRVHAPDIPVAAGTGQVFWKGPDDDSFEEARCVAWRVPNDGEFHVHRVQLEGHPRLPELVQWLRLDLIDGACKIVDCRSLRIW